MPPNMEQSRCKEEAEPMNKALICEAIHNDLNMHFPCNTLSTCIRITGTVCSGNAYCKLKKIKTWLLHKIEHF